MKKSHLIIGFTLLLAIFILVCIQTYNTVSLSSGSYLNNKQLASLLPEIIKSATLSYKTQAIPTPIPPPSPSDECVKPNVDYPLPNGGSFCTRPLQPGQALNLEVCFPTGTDALGIPVNVCLRIKIGPHLSYPGVPFVLQISGGNWWNFASNLQCVVVGTTPSGGLKLSCTSSKWIGAKDICINDDGSGGMVVSYCDSTPMPAGMEELFPGGRPFRLPLIIPPKATKPNSGGYIPPSWVPKPPTSPIPPTSKPPTSLKP